MVYEIKILDTPLDLNHCFWLAQSPDCGAVALFAGTVRNQTKGRQVRMLEYEAYEPMAISEMEKIAQDAKSKWPVKKLAIHHRTGTLEIGETAVIIAVSTPHRQASFEACQYIIDRLKQTVPIWKKEVLEDGEVWVAAHP